MIALETRSLCKSFGSLVVTQDVSLAFEAGSRYAIIGPNGAGKTTYFNLLAGNLRPDSGTVHFAGRDVTALDMTSRARIGIARSFQRNNLFPDFTVRDNLALACALRAGTTRVFWRPMRKLSLVHAEAEEIAARVGLTDVLSTTVRQLSYGSQRQLEVALALACKPQVLLLDEPTSGHEPSDETSRMHALIAHTPRRSPSSSSSTTWTSCSILPTGSSCSTTAACSSREPRPRSAPRRRAPALSRRTRLRLQ